jgi:hypothetical protein
MNNEITREEAIKILGEMHKWTSNVYEEKKALDMVIKALSEHPKKWTKAMVREYVQGIKGDNSLVADLLVKFADENNLIEEPVKEKKWRVAWRVKKDGHGTGNGTTLHMTRKELDKWYESNQYQFMQEIDEILE